MAWEAECCPPVELTYLDVYASGALQDEGIEVSVPVDDAHPAARAKHPSGLAQGPGAFFAAPDVAEGQVAENYVKGPGGQREVPGIACTKSTRSLTPSIIALRSAAAWLLPVWSRRRQMSAPVARP